MFMRRIYDERLAQAAYLIGCQRSGEAIVIDPERDVDRYLDLAAENDLRIVATAETHIHADFVSGSRELAEQVGAKVYVSGEGGNDWQYQWLDQKIGGGAYEYAVLHDGDRFSIGNIELEVLHTPGHTPEHLVFFVTDRGGGADEPMGVVSGDFVFVGDLGRPDLLETAAGHAGAMEPSARQLFKSVKLLDGVAGFVQVWPAHGAGSACGKALGAVPASTIGYEKKFNPAIRAAADEAGFVDFILSGQPEPPPYFATMKKWNRAGPPVLGSVPSPPKIEVDDLRNIDRPEVTLVDTRPWREFRSGYVPGALSMPLSRTFNTDVGSFVGADDPVVLIVDPARLDEAVRDLIRIGIDRIQGWVDAGDLRSFEADGARLSTIAEVTPDEAASLLEDRKVAVLDVRRATEFSQGHLPGAINIAHTRLVPRLDEVPRGAPLLVNCRTGRRSARACSFLRRHGYDCVNLAGGFSAWNQPPTEFAVRSGHEQ